MGRRLKQAAIVFVVLIAAAQLVRPSHANHPTDPRRTIQAQMGTADGLVAVLDRSCGDCHSNRAVSSRWYTQIAPMSWLMAYGVAQGRRAVNFSEWADYPPERQRQLLIQSCEEASHGRMPGVYTMFRPDVRLTTQDLETICAAARQAEARASR